MGLGGVHVDGNLVVYFQFCQFCQFPAKPKLAIGYSACATRSRGGRAVVARRQGCLAHALARDRDRDKSSQSSQTATQPILK
jgi:hypothetical protein